MFKPELIVRIESNENENDDSVIDTQECALQEMLSDELCQDDVNVETSQTESQDLGQQLEHNLAALFF